MADAELEGPSSPVAPLTVVVGVGNLSSNILHELGIGLSFVPEGHDACVALYDASAKKATLTDTTSALISNKNLDRLETLGYQIPSRAVGQRVQLRCFFIIDLGDTAATGNIGAQLDELSKVAVTVHSMAFLVGPGSLNAILSSDAAKYAQWEIVIPVLQNDPVAGNRSSEDLVQSVARAVLVLTVPTLAGPLSGLFSHTRHGPSPGAVVLRIGAAFVDGRLSDLLDSLSRRLVARLLETQFSSPKRFQPSTLFDDGQKTKLVELATSERIARELLSETPFILEVASGKPWRVRLPEGDISVELRGLDRSRWVPVLRKLRDFFDFTKGQRWRESIDKAELRLTNELREAITSDLIALHSYVRGPDRVITWCEHLQNVLEILLEIESVKRADFEPAVARLEQEIVYFPKPVAVWARFTLLGLLAAVAAQMFGAIWFGQGFSWVLASGALLLTLAVGANFLERVGSHLWIFKPVE